MTMANPQLTGCDSDPRLNVPDHEAVRSGIQADLVLKPHRSPAPNIDAVGLNARGFRCHGLG